MLKLKKFAVLLAVLFIAAKVTSAAVISIADTPFNSAYQRVGGSSSDEEDGRHTSVFEDVNFPSCGSVTTPYQTDDSISANLCAAALRTDASRISYQRCGTGAKGNCTYKETCTGLAGTGFAVTGTDSAAISQSISRILSRYSGMENNLAVEAARCSQDGLPYIYLKCDSSYNQTSEPNCPEGQTAAACSLNPGQQLWKCDYQLCTAAQLNQTAGDNIPASSPLLKGTKTAGYCYEKLADGSRKLRTIYACDESVYTYSESSCRLEAGSDFLAVSAEAGNCVWNGAFRNGQNTEIDYSQTLYQNCLRRCPAETAASPLSCPLAGDVLLSCALPGTSGNTVASYCGCPQNADGSEQFYDNSNCSGAKLPGGETCRSSVTGELRYRLCLPQCLPHLAAKNSPTACYQAFVEENKASGFTSLPDLSASSADYCADASGKKTACASALQCCSFFRDGSLNDTVSCASSFVPLADGASCSKMTADKPEERLCFKSYGDAGASYQCECPSLNNYVSSSCPDGTDTYGFCSFDGGIKNICVKACNNEDIAAGFVKSDIAGCRIKASDVPNATLCLRGEKRLEFRCSCPLNYNYCAGNVGGGNVCQFDGGQKFEACRLNRSAIICDENRKVFDDPSACKTTGGTLLNAVQCFKEGAVKYMCDCPDSYAVCGEGKSGGGDRCTVYDNADTYYETCGTTCRINTVDRPVVDNAAECPAVNGDTAATSQCVANGSVKYECKCPAGYTDKPYADAIGVGDACTFDGGLKYKEYKKGCPTDRPLFYTKEDCAFEGVKGINVTECYVEGTESDENLRFFCDCPTTYSTDAKCKTGNSSREGAGLICPLEVADSDDLNAVKFQYCLNTCNSLPSASDKNGVILEDSIDDSRACKWALGQGATYEQCSKNHTILNKCYCGLEYASRLTCLPEDNLTPLIDASHSSCTIDNVTYYQACKPRKCKDGALLAASQAGCQTLLGTAATGIKCAKDNDSADYYECACDTSYYKQTCIYPSKEPGGTKFCYRNKYDAASNPEPAKLFPAGSCQVGSLDKCYTDGKGPAGYIVTVTASESACRSALGDGATARLCEDPADPDIRRFNCMFNAADYKWTNANCPVRHTLTGGSVVINGTRYYKECSCHAAYKYHRYNCAGILSGGGCEQDVSASNNDGTIPTDVTKLKFYPFCACSEDYSQVCDGERNVGVGEPCNGKYVACECKPDELPDNWVDNYYGCPGGKKPTGVTKPNGCGGKFYQCEVSQCTWQHTEQCKGDYQTGVDPCQDNQGNVAGYKSCKCPDGWHKCSGSLIGVGKPCSLNGENYYASCKSQDECANGEYLTCTGELQVGVNACTKNDKIYFEKCTCASGYNKVCGDGQTGVGAACVIDGVSYYAECTKPAETCTDQHKVSCAANQEKYEPCVTADKQVKYKCRCPANYTSCAATAPAESAAACVDSERGTVYSACTAENTCTVSEEKIYKTCTDQQLGVGQSCTSSDGSTKYADCQEVKDCKANGYKYTCSGFQSSALGTDFCIDDKGSKLYKECLCPISWITCNANNTKGTPCTPLYADGTTGETVYSKCTCDESVFKYTCVKEEEGNIGVIPGNNKSCTPRTYDAATGQAVDGTVMYKSCDCEKSYLYDCRGNGIITNSKDYCQAYTGAKRMYKSCECDTAIYNQTCSDTSNPGMIAPSEASAKCIPLLEGGVTGTPVYSKCACGSAYTLTCTGNGQVKSNTDFCAIRDAKGTMTTTYSHCACADDYRYTCEGSTAPEPTASGVCSAVIYEGGEHKTKNYYKSCSCTEGGFYDTEQENMKCTPTGYEGRNCHDCYQPECSEGGYDTAEKEGYICTPTPYYGRSCYSCTKDPCYDLEDMSASCDYGCKKTYDKCPSKCQMCDSCDDSCPSGYQTSPCSGSQTTLDSQQNECKHTCYSCEDKTCGSCGMYSSPAQCPDGYECVAATCGGNSCWQSGKKQSCADLGMQDSDDPTQKCTKDSSSGCWRCSGNRTCLDGGYYNKGDCVETDAYACSTDVEPPYNLMLCEKRVPK